MVARPLLFHIICAVIVRFVEFHEFQAVCPHEGLLTRNISYNSINCKAKRIYDTKASYPVSTVCKLNCRRQFRVSQMQPLHTK